MRLRLPSFGGARAREAGRADRGIDNLMVVLRESVGANKLDETLQPFGALHAVVDGREIETEMAWFQFLGDMHIRFVFDAPQTMESATPDDLQRLNLSPEDALARAVANIKRVYGKPQLQWLEPPAMQVLGDSEYLNSSYFLDRDFWRTAAKVHTDGVVVGVPKRGALILIPAGEVGAVAGLGRVIAELHVTSEEMRVSSALYLFKEDRWTVFQPPVPDPPPLGR